MLIIHLSDIHFSTERSQKPPEKIIAAIRGLDLSPKFLILAVTGDIASSGDNSQYTQATDCFNTLKEGLESEYGVTCELVVCPGNHDCSYPDDSAVRDLVVKDIRCKAKLPESPDMIQSCTSVQDNFFRWANEIGGIPSECDDRLSWTALDHGDEYHHYSISVVNSAWISTLKETQGTIFFPTSRLPERPVADLHIALMHHPYNWFEAHNAREIRRTLEDTCDIVLTGHEHDCDQFMKIKSSEHQTIYVEGGAFNGNEEVESAFNVIDVDIAKHRYRVMSICWERTRYSCATTSDWMPFLSNAADSKKESSLSSDMIAFLENPGIELSHRAKTITLEDIFVAPDLRTFKKSETKEPSTPTIVPSRFVLNALIDNGKAYILGSGQCGKTSLAKMLFLHEIRRKRLPVYLSVDGFTSDKASRLKSLVESAVSKQYRNLHLEDFWQTDIDDRVAIIDNFVHVKMNTKGKQSILKWIMSHFGSYFVFGGELTQIEELIIQTPTDKVSNAGLDLQRFEIRSFGYVLRDHLIEKWVTLGREHEIDTVALHHEVRVIAGMVNALLGKNLLPASPVYVLMLLQQREAGIPLRTESGSYGYFYEAILTLALGKTSSSSEDIGEKYTYLSELAWHMFVNGDNDIDSESFDTFTREHVDKFDLTTSPKKLQKEIVESRLLSLSYDKYTFVYRYFFYYFIARHARDNIDEPEIQPFLDDAIDSIHREDYANILIFFTYLTQNRRIIQQILNRTRRLFQDVPPCDLAKHVEFIKRIQENVPQIVLPDGDPISQRREVLNKRDQKCLEGEGTESSENDVECSKIEEQSEIELLMSINRAIKSLQVLGQILRNFGGSLPSQLKTEIIRECFDLSLRVLNAYCQSLERHLEPSLILLADLFGRDFSEIPERKRVQAAKEFIFYITEMMCHATIQRISFAVGSERLLRTYERLEHCYDNRATRFVQLGLRLDHCKRFPEKRVLTLMEEVKTDVVGLTLLRLIVAEHFYFFPRPYRTRQKICAALGISFKKTVSARQYKKTTLAAK